MNNQTVFEVNNSKNDRELIVLFYKWRLRPISNKIELFIFFVLFQDFMLTFDGKMPNPAKLFTDMS